jgi:FHS family Na+ dependent glucose MFS transporter 1
MVDSGDRMQKHRKRYVLVIACLMFFSLGMMTAAIGPVLPDLAKQAGSDLAAIGSVFTAIFLGALLAQLVSGPIGDRIGMGTVLIGGITLLAAGTLGITLSRALPLTLALALLAGLGHGAVDLGGTVLIANIYNNQAVSALNLLNVFFGLGAFVGPAVAGFALKTWATGLPAMWVSTALLLGLLPFLIKIRTSKSERGKSVDLAAPVINIYRSPLLWGLGLLILLYVGTENGMGGWITTYMARTTPMRIEQAALVASGFWLALTAGRMASAALGLRFTSQSLLTGSLMAASCGSLLLVLSAGRVFLAVAAVLLIGFSLGSIYPTVMALTTAVFAQGPGKAASVVAAMGSLGGMALPWLQGVLLVKTGPSASSWFTAIASLLMLSLIVIIRVHQGRKAQFAYTA